MILRIISMFCYVISGFLFFPGIMVSFTTAGTPRAKLISMGIFSALGLLTITIGLALQKFRNWRRSMGLVLVWISGLGAFMILQLYCVFSSAEILKLPPGAPMFGFTDYSTGISYLALYALVGSVLIWKSPSDKPDR